MMLESDLKRGQKYLYIISGEYLKYVCMNGNFAYCKSEHDEGLFIKPENLRLVKED